MIFIANANSHYFSISPSISIDMNLLQKEGCTICATLDDLYTHVTETLSLDLDEVEGTELLITMSENEAKCIDDRGNAHIISGDVNEFISAYQL